MANFLDADIAFYSKYQAGIQTIFNDPDVAKHQLHFDMMFFAGLVFVQMSNLRGTNLDNFIANSLRLIKLVDVCDFNLGDYIQGLDIEIEVPELVRYRGKGEKGFGAVLNLIQSSYEPSLRLRPRGFGLLGREVKYYALQSINALLRHYAIKYKADPHGKEVLSTVASDCGREYSSGGIGPGFGQGQAIQKILKQWQW